MTKKERRKMKQAGVENFGKKSGKREIPYWLDGVFDDPSKINWAMVDAYQDALRKFLLEHGDEFCEYVKAKTGEDVYWTIEGKIFGKTSVKISHDQMETLMNEFLLMKYKEGNI